MSRRKIDPVPQRQLALRLRYHIDCALRSQSREQHEEAVRNLVEENPTSLRSRHVAHNIGAARLDWLEQHGYLP